MMAENSDSVWLSRWPTCLQQEGLRVKGHQRQAWRPSAFTHSQILMIGQSPLDTLLIFGGSCRTSGPCYSGTSNGSEFQSHGCFRERNSLGNYHSLPCVACMMESTFILPRGVSVTHTDMQGSLAFSNQSTGLCAGKPRNGSAECSLTGQNADPRLIHLPPFSLFQNCTVEICFIRNFLSIFPF